MYNSLKAWANIPLDILPFVKHDTAGDPSYSDRIEALCYPEAKLRKVVDREGREVLSSTTLYIDPVWRNPINEYDVMIFEGKHREIKAVSAFYRAGQVDIWVVNI